MIKGLKPRLAEAGKIKIGKKGKKTTSARGVEYYPAVKLDHFLVTTTQKGPDENFILNDQVMEALSKPKKEGGYADKDGKVKEIPILLLSDDIEDVFPTSYAKWHGQQKHCEGDGEKATRYELKKNEQGYVERTGQEKEIKCPCQFLLGENPTCKACGTLHCAINIPGIATIGSVYLWRTKSIISIKEMLGSLLDIQARCGVLQNLPLLLRVSPVKTKRGTVQCCHIAMTADNVLQVMREALEIRTMMGSLRNAEMPSYRAIAGASEDERDYDDADDDDGGDYIDTDGRDTEPSEPPQDDPPPPEEPVPGSVSGAEGGAPPVEPEGSEQDVPISRENPLYLKLTEVFIDLCKRRNMTGKGRQAERDAFWKEHCEKAIGIHLSDMPTTAQANELITHFRGVLSQPPAETPPPETPPEEQGLPGVA